jgi:hypothetical protein
MADLTSCGVALLLLVDVSGSVDANEYNLQKTGYVNAFKDPKVVEVISKKSTPIYLALAEWAGRTELVIEWRKISERSDLFSFSNDYSVSKRKLAANYSTDISQAINMGVDYFNQLPCKPEQKIIDVSGDGSDDGGEGSTRLLDAVKKAEAFDVTINGLPIESGEVGLQLYYKTNVITTNGFVVAAKNFPDFARALLKKLIFELS